MECTIIGGGVQGLSTGVLLQYMGHDTTLVSDSIAYVDGPDMSAVCTNYAAASVYPVQVESEYSEDELIRQAEATFKPFCEADGVPVRKHKHYYVYEDEQPGPNPARMDVQDVTEYDGDIPARDGHAVDDGYVCKEYFVEMPEYVPQLYDAYLALGGETEQRRVTADELDALSEQPVFNCSGYGSRDLFGDESMRAVKGHILQVPYDGDEPLPFSYTYTPTDYSHYAYMYPRQDTVLFGGSYLMGNIDDGRWEGESPEQPMTIDGETIPERLYTVNRDIISAYIDVEREHVSAKHGFRPYREDGMRIEKDGNVVHNYGHGGSGVSMSWWSVLRAVGYVADVSADVLPGLAATLAEVTEA
jgi:D-amino-acid oxidase